jgi:hypothetical protein
MVSFEEILHLRCVVVLGPAVLFLKQFGEDVQPGEDLTNGVWFCDLTGHNVRLFREDGACYERY